MAASDPKRTRTSAVRTWRATARLDGGSESFKIPEQPNALRGADWVQSKDLLKFRWVGSSGQHSMYRQSRSWPIVSLLVAGVFVTLMSGSARAFKEDGLQSGMEMDDAVLVFRASFGQGTDATFPGTGIRAYTNLNSPARAIYSCHDRLTAYEKELPGEDRGAFTAAVEAESRKLGKAEHTVKRGTVPMVKNGKFANLPTIDEAFSWKISADETERITLSSIGTDTPTIHLLRFVRNDCGIGD